MRIPFNMSNVFICSKCKRGLFQSALPMTENVWDPGRGFSCLLLPTLHPTWCPTARTRFVKPNLLLLSYYYQYQCHFQPLSTNTNHYQPLPTTWCQSSLAASDTLCQNFPPCPLLKWGLLGPLWDHYRTFWRLIWDFYTSNLIKPCTYLKGWLASSHRNSKTNFHFSW